MKGKITWLTVSCLVTLSLVLTSCAPAAAPEKVTPKVTTKTEKTAEPKKAAPEEKVAAVDPDKPRYGGTITIPTRLDTQGFDQIYQRTAWNRNFGQHLGNDRLLMGDVTMGPMGSRETDFSNPGWAPEGIFRTTGMLAESFEIPNDQTIIFKIRKGVYWHNKAPVNGRQLTAEDIVYSIKYMYLNPDYPLTYNMITAPGGNKLLSAEIDPNDPWTVIVKVEGIAWGFLEDLGVKGVHVIAHESIKEHGDLLDWKSQLGTGGFMLTDYVAESSYTFVKNPHYWLTNPIGKGKGDQLPYADGVKVLIIKDKSTVQSALRTGKVDAMGEWGHATKKEDMDSILGTNPDMNVKEKTASGMRAVGIRLTSDDPLAAPLMKQRVRWALSMAIDREEMIRDYYQGAAIPFVFHFPPDSPYATTFDEKVKTLETVFGIPPDEAIMIKKAFEYNPEEAKNILTEEGYPNGFPTIVITSPAYVDELSVIKGYWAKIGVDLEIDQKDNSVWRSVIDSHKTQAMFPYSVGYGTNPAKWVFYGPGDPTKPLTVSNRWELSDPVLDDLIQRTNAVYGSDFETQMRLLQEAEAWITWKAPWIAHPGYHTYTLWNPWLKNFHGDEDLGFRSHHYFAYYAWIDQDLKDASR